MKNFKIIHNDNEYWISRSTTVECFVLTIIDDEWCVLANKRGKGAADFCGYWNVPCGYVDWNETTAQSAIREVYEETGIVIQNVSFWEFNDFPSSNNQNITFRYFSLLQDAQLGSIQDYTIERGGEINEVSDISWIPIRNISRYQWAFNHDILIFKLVHKLQLC